MYYIRRYIFNLCKNIYQRIFYASFIVINLFIYAWRSFTGNPFSGKKIDKWFWIVNVIIALLWLIPSFINAIKQTQCEYGEDHNHAVYSGQHAQTKERKKISNILRNIFRAFIVLAIIAAMIIVLYASYRNHIGDDFSIMTLALTALIICAVLAIPIGIISTDTEVVQPKKGEWKSKSQMKKSERAQNQLLDGYAGGKAFEEEINSQTEKLEGCMYIPSSTLANGDTRYKHEGSSETDGILITPAGIVVLEMKYMSIEDVTWAAVPKSEYWEKHETIKYFDEQSAHELKNIENGNDEEKKKLDVIRSPLFQNDKHIKVILNTLRSNGYNYDGRGHKIYNMIVLNKDLRYRAYDKEFSTKKEGFLDMTSSDVPFLVTVKGLKKKFKDWYRSQPRELADWEMKTIYNILSKADMQDHEGHVAYVKELTGSNN